MAFSDVHAGAIKAADLARAFDCDQEPQQISHRNKRREPSTSRNGGTRMIFVQMLLTLIFLGATFVSAGAETRLALIITNSSYKGNVLSRLDSTHADGELLARILKKVGFDVVHKE